MKLSTKGRYAMIALTDLAAQGPDRLVSLSEIAERQDISLAYLEQLFVKLRRAEIVESVRGPGGGYRLARPVERDPHLRNPRRRRRDHGRAVARRRRLRRRRRHARAGARRQALGAALGQRLRDAAPDPARRRGEEPARALSGGAGFVAVVDERGVAPARELARRAGLSRLERDGAAAARGPRGDGGGDGRRSATRRRCMPRAARRGPSSSGRGRRSPTATGCSRGRRRLHLRRHRGGGAGAGRARADGRGGRARLRRRLGRYVAAGRRRRAGWRSTDPAASVLQAANSETGVVQDLPRRARLRRRGAGGRQDSLRLRLERGADGAGLGAQARRAEGVGALLLRAGRRARGRGCAAAGRRAGGGPGPRTSIGIAGFGAAAAAAAARSRRAASGTRSPRCGDILEAALESAASDDLFWSGRAALRLPNTSCFVGPGWKGETQVMQMDLAGFAVSAGSACSSGKVRASRVLAAMGLGAGSRERPPGLDRAGNDARRGPGLRRGLGETLSPVPGRAA